MRALRSMNHDIPIQTWIHLGAILPAMVLGAVQFARAKGTPGHRWLGRLWAAIMLLAAITSFWIQRAGLSWIHGLSVVTIVSVMAGIFYARRARRRAHGLCMAGAFLGSLGAGIGALSPGRLLHALLFGG